MNVIEITAKKKRQKKPSGWQPTAEHPVTAKTSFTSFAAQIRYYKDYERRHPQYKLVDIYADEAVIIGLKTLRLKKC